LKTVIKIVGVLFLSLIIFSFINDTFFENNSNISSSMYNDSQRILSVINNEFLTYSTIAKVNENKINEIFDLLEGYSDEYQPRNINTDEEEILFQDISFIVQDYLLLVNLDLSHEDIPIDLNINSKYSGYMSSKRDIYEDFLRRRRALKDKYGFAYQQ
jgi:hypothetical protein